MPSASAFALFCLASVALAVIPGPAVTYEIGLRRLAGADRGDEVQAPPAALARLYRQGVIVNVFNPKTVLAGRLRRGGRGARARRYATGLVFPVLGITAAATHRPS